MRRFRTMASVQVNFGFVDAVPSGARINVPVSPGSVAARKALPGPSPENQHSTSTVVDSRKNFQYE